MLNVEIAKTPFALERGLMFRKHLGEDEGMLFEFAYEQPLRFWGENTLIPLDVAFINVENKIVDIKEIKPMSRDAVTSSCNCLRAIEANAGFFADNGIGIGCKIEIEYDPYFGTGIGTIIFKNENNN
jgi:hypothetical protein